MDCTSSYLTSALHSFSPLSMAASDESSASSPPNSNPPQQTTPSSFEPTWQLPPGIENHIEALIIKSALGIAIGAPLGFLAFRSGRGAGAAAGMAFGVGCAVGSFVERGIIGGEGVDPAVPKFDFGWMSGLGGGGEGSKKE
jgi:hypothetical protein